MRLQDGGRGPIYEKPRPPSLPGSGPPMSPSSDPAAPGALSLSVVESLSAVDSADWDRCAGHDNPFVSHAFLLALEDSGSASVKTGWLPRHAVLHDDQGRLRACAPLYLKSHSYGEYVFDWGWAEAYERAGKRYYPKLQCAVPFTPATGPRLLVPTDDPEADRLRDTLAAGLVEIARRLKVSSLHITFPSAAEVPVLEAQGMLVRLGMQYHWQNRGYASFDDFLAALSSRKRKTIRKERERANGQGVRIRTLSGAAIEPRHWQAFHGFYLDTVERKWGQAYLSADFFPRLGATMGERVVLVVGEDETSGEVVCGALNLLGGDTLYGRNWGSLSPYTYLHFEVCYYRAIDFAIEHGLTWVEAGAQGDHKISRGYLPRPTWSGHWIADAGFRRAVAAFVERERATLEGTMEALEDLGPFRCEGPAP
ncbi:GNAT family N-acetyltransferase [Rhodospirillum rubrum]|nr:GNAT family N-acetyltransferase [Rhodospirillum rubrum]MBK1677013.1 GNAT family N-acetyltransferase [Rhodospirillum rubrum]